MNAKELTRLMEAHLDGQLTVAEARDLSRVLISDQAARRQFWEHTAVHGLAQEAARLAWLGTAAPAGESTLVRPRGWRWLAPLAVAAAVTLVLAIGWWRRGGDEPSGQGVAILSRVVGVEWAEAASARAPGAVLAPGTVRLNAGAVLLEFYSGARVVLEGPAEFEVVSAGEAFLRSGRLSAQVPPQGRGFKIASPTLTVVDLGTEFGLAVAQRAAAEVHVFAGRVELAARTAGAVPRALTNGQAGRLESGAWRPLPAARGGFLDETELARREAAGAEARFAAWSQASRVLSTDRAALIHYTFQDQPPRDRAVANQVPDAPPETQGSIVGGSWTEGRWPHKRALELRGAGDRIRLTATQALARVTLLAWVRVEGLPRGMRSLLSAETDQPGALRWELTGEGRLRLGIARDLGHRQLDWEAVMSERVVTPEVFGHWLLLATTFDGSTVRHYCNGQLVGSGASFRPAALRLGAADLGNWRGHPPRNLLARLDEFALLARAVSDAELQRLYQAGQPATVLAARP